MNTSAMDVYWALQDAYHSVKRDLHNKLAEQGVTWPQFHALYHIGEAGTPAHELAKELNCNASNMTGLIDRMIENNWVYREHCQADRRVWYVKLTEEGAQLRARLIPEYQQNIRDRMGVLNPEELNRIHALLKKLSSFDWSLTS